MHGVVQGGGSRRLPKLLRNPRTRGNRVNNQRQIFGIGPFAWAQPRVPVDAGLGGVYGNPPPKKEAATKAPSWRT